MAHENRGVSHKGLYLWEIGEATARAVLSSRLNKPQHDIAGFPIPQTVGKSQCHKEVHAEAASQKPLSRDPTLVLPLYPTPKTPFLFNDYRIAKEFVVWPTTPRIRIILPILNKVVGRTLPIHERC